MGTVAERTDVRQARRRPSHGGVIAELRGHCRTEQQADAAERMLRYLSRVQAREGSTIRRTWRQLAIGVGKPARELSQREARVRYRAGMRNTIDYLIKWGYVESFDTLYEPNGEGRCIVVVVPAGVAQSVRATRLLRTDVRRPRRGPRSSISPKVGTPCGGTIGGPGDFGSSSHPTEEKADARARELGTRDRAAASTAARAALEIAVAFGSGESWTGATVLEARPDLEALPVDVVAREAWRLFAGADAPTRRGDGRLSTAQRARLDVAASQLERTGYGPLPPGPSASRAAAIDLALGDWADHWRDTKPPATLGGLVCCLRHLAHELVRGARVRRRRTHAAAASGSPHDIARARSIDSQGERSCR